MQAKKKICDNCQKEQYIWKNQSGVRYCKDCWGRHKPSKTNKPTRVPLQAVSQKRKKQDLAYSKLRKRYLEEHSLCNVKVTGCTSMASDIHHTYAGSNRAVYYLIQSTWMPVCRNCHNWIHGNPAEARIMNYLK
jgi:hypothetical protein